MKRLTPAAVSLMTVVVVGLLVTAYFAKVMLAGEPKARSRDASQEVAVSPAQHPATDATKKSAVEYRAIPLALGNLEPGTRVTSGLVGMGRVPADTLQPETILSERALVGRFVKEPIAVGTPIRSSQLYAPGEHPPLVVAAGMRAVSLSFSPRGSFVGGLLRNGEYVDVYLTPRADDGADSRFRGGVTITLLNGVRVLAVGEESGSGSAGHESVNTVTLELTPEQANILILAREKGEIALSYNPDGKGTGGVAAKSSDRATMDEILGSSPSRNESTALQATESRPLFTSEFFKAASGPRWNLKNATSEAFRDRRIRLSIALHNPKLTGRQTQT